ncbi:type II toxin-antitoxin system RelE family toxin [Tautonia rosea]|uniref:type II toxin-antitoxin system RelE family toxin n=1 Tax=Tautonia rosea TaxID=2728037 RepID=UPI001473CFF3|nr:type II toxin-antitoxin system RelE/ParE family toxin [Tautonia rosea]
MTWRVEFDDRARRSLRKLNPHIQEQILEYLRSRIATAEDPRRFGKPLSGSKAGLWRYRIGDHRIICSIADDRLVVLVVALGHRKLIYQ